MAQKLYWVFQYVLFFISKKFNAFRHVVNRGTLAGNVDIFSKILTNADFSFVKLRIDVLQNLPGNLDLLFYDVVCWASLMREPS